VGSGGDSNADDSRGAGDWKPTPTGKIFWIFEWEDAGVCGDRIEFVGVEECAAGHCWSGKAGTG